MVAGCTPAKTPAITCPGDSVEPAALPDPDGRIFWRSEGGAGPCSGIYSMRPDGTDVRRVARIRSEPFFIPMAPTLSPDGRMIAFFGQCLTTDFDLCVIGTDGAGLRGVTPGPVFTGHSPTWSSDGGRIAFSRYVGPEFVVDVVSLDGTGQTVLVDPGGEAAWSPDGSRIAFVRNGQIHLVNPDGTGIVRISDGPGDGYPAWSPDGTRLAFSSGRAAKPEFVPDIVRQHPEVIPPTNLRPPQPAGDIYVMQADGTDVMRLTDDPSDNVDPAWSPEGTRIVFSSVRDQDYDLYLMKADGTDQTQLTDIDSSDYSASWTS